MVIGERDIHTPQDRSRTVGKKLIRLIGEYLVEQPLPDFNSGFRAFKRNYIALIKVNSGFTSKVLFYMDSVKRDCISEYTRWP